MITVLMSDHAGPSAKPLFLYTNAPELLTFEISRRCWKAVAAVKLASSVWNDRLQKYDITGDAAAVKESQAYTMTFGRNFDLPLAFS